MEQGEAQAIEGYGCTCGFKTTNKKEFTTHVMLAARADGKGTHGSVGRVNMETGDITMPKYVDRTEEERRESRYAPSKPGSGDRRSAKELERRPSRGTDILGDATQLRFVPRVFTTDYTPVMMMAREIVINKWGWRPDMPFQNLIDTIFYHFFDDRGYKLTGYIISEEAQKELDEINAEKEKQEVV